MYLQRQSVSSSNVYIYTCPPGFGVTLKKLHVGLFQSECLGHANGTLVARSLSELKDLPRQCKQLLVARAMGALATILNCTLILTTIMDQDSHGNNSPSMTT